MGRKPCCEKVGLKRGPWAAEEDKKLVSFINTHGVSCWRAVPKLAGLLRCGKSCRLRWTNYLRPDLKRGILTEAEENLVLELHATLGNRWSRIAVQLPGRTDNEIKNFWNTRLKKRLRSMGLDPDTHKPIESSDGTDMDRTVNSNLEENSSAATAGSQHSEHGCSSPDPPLAPGSHLSGEVAAQVKTLEGEPACGNALINMDRSKPGTMIMNPKQGLQSNPDLLLSNTKDEKPLSLSLLENFHTDSSSLGQDGPKVEDSFMSDLHPHARHLRLQDENNDLVNSSHELAGENRSSGIFQDLDVGINLLRQSSGFGFSDMGVGNWSCLGQSPSCSTTLSSWSDLHGAGRPLQEPELQKLAAILDQI